LSINDGSIFSSHNIDYTACVLSKSGRRSSHAALQREDIQGRQREGAVCLRVHMDFRREGIVISYLVDGNKVVVSVGIVVEEGPHGTTCQGTWATTVGENVTLFGWLLVRKPDAHVPVEAGNKIVSI
jgi:hypothetical protein